MLLQILFVILAILLFLACAALLVVELFIPSLGLLSLMAMICLAGGIALFFSISPTGGWIGVFLAIVIIPSSWWGFYWMLPRTAIGKALLFQYPSESLGAGIPGQDELSSLAGQSGVVLTALRPVGICKFDDKKVVCVSETDYIDKGQTITVLHVEGTKVTVRKLEQT
jgi:membrane-bound serine protease (ClpP class)